MRRTGILVGLAAPLLVGWSFFDPFHAHVEEGNRQAEENQAEEALRSYGEAARVDPGSPIPDFNRGIVLTREGKTEEARDAFLGAAAAPDSGVAADALYNLGNALMEGQQLEPAVEAYLKSLDLDPDDADARRNLEIALQRLEQQQQQQQQDQQQQNDDSQDQQEQEQQQQQQQDQQEGDDSREETPQSDEEQQEEQQQPQPQEMTREDAERLLNAVQSDELKVLQQLQEKEGREEAVTDDW